MIRNSKERRAFIRINAKVNMKYTKEDLTLEKGIEKEWIITNGLGGFASSTIIGINTRKYHGLLVAPLTPPARRHLILSKLDESIEVEGKKYEIYSNMGQNYISKGYKYQISFEKEELPIFKYKINDIEIKKTICMQYGKNTVGILYKIKTGEKPIKLNLAPIMNFRDFHSMNTGHRFETRQEINKNKVKVIIDNIIQYPVYMNVSEGKYIKHDGDTFNNMFYIEEQKRGFYPEENHVVVGRYEIEIPANQEKEVSFVCSFEENIEEIDVKKLITQEKNRIRKIIEQSKIIEKVKNEEEQSEMYIETQELLKNLIIASDTFIVKRLSFNLHTIIAGYPWFLDWGRDSLISFEGLLLKTKKELARDELIKTYLIAADNFIAYRPNFRLHTLIAGYHWFLDWGRDSLIAFEGLLLIPKRFELAKEILQTMVRDIKYGLVPNGYSGYDNRPLYNSVDASLLLFEEIQKYITYTGDYKFVKQELYEKLETIIENYCNGIDVDSNNIYLDNDGLIVSGTEDTQNTWMDAKYDGIAVTPRNGKAVEVNSLWYNANKIMESLSKKCGHPLKAKKYKQLAEECKIAFNNKFYNPKNKCLYDVLGDSKIRPNQLFSLSLTYPVVEPDSNQAYDIIATVEKKLLNAYGLKTLAKGEKDYVEVYEGDGRKRDMSYHQGITWPWLLGLYYDALKNMLVATNDEKRREELEKKIDKFVVKTNKTFKKELYENGCVGSISELYDSCPPRLPKGAIAQAWSVAEVFRIVLKK